MIIARYTIYLDENMDKKLKKIMAINKINMKSKAIKMCIENAFERNYNDMTLSELNNKLNKLIYRQSVNKKLIEQIFCNMGFQDNESIEKDPILKKFYDDLNSYKWWYD